MPNLQRQVQSSLLQYLPSIFQQKESALGQFLKAFEKILVGIDDGVNIEFAKENGKSGKSLFGNKGFEEVVDLLPVLFDPKETPEEFLVWLSDWTAFSVRADLTVKQQRNFLANIIKLYRRRGTKENLQELLSIFTVGRPEINEPEGSEFNVGSSKINEDTYIGGQRPHYFTVKIFLPDISPDLIRRQIQIARSLIDLEKPAHTNYELEVFHKTMKINERSTIGVDTLLGKK